MGRRERPPWPSTIFTTQPLLKACEAPPGSAGARASPRTPHSSFPVRYLAGVGSPAVLGVACRGSPCPERKVWANAGPMSGWPHGTVTAAAFQEGNGSAPAVQGTALPCRHLPEKTHSWKGAQGWLCSPCSQLGEHRESTPACGGTPMQRGDPHSSAAPGQRGETGLSPTPFHQGNMPWKETFHPSILPFVGNPFSSVLLPLCAQGRLLIPLPLFAQGITHGL